MRAGESRKAQGGEIVLSDHWEPALKDAFDVHSFWMKSTLLAVVADANTVVVVFHRGETSLAPLESDWEVSPPLSSANKPFTSKPRSLAPPNLSPSTTCFRLWVKIRNHNGLKHWTKYLLDVEQAWTSIFYLKSFDMDSVQVGKAVFGKEIYTTLGIEPRTYS